MPVTYFLHLAEAVVPCATLMDALEHPEAREGAFVARAGTGEVVATLRREGDEGAVAWVVGA